MKLTLLTPALVAILGLALVSVPVTVQAQTPAPATAAPTKAAKPKKTEYKGTLTAVDTAGSSITVGEKSPKTIAITPTTKIMKDGKAATLADFAVGEKVSGSYTTDASGKMVAAKLNTKTKAAATTTAAVKPATKPASTTPAPASSPAPAGQ